MSNEPRPKYDIEAIRERLTMAEVCAKDNVVVRKMGPSLKARCPFHEEKSGSFTIGGRSPDTAHCFGCGWHGDIFAFWQQRHGLTFPDAVEKLASLCGVAPRIEGVAWQNPKAKVVTRVRQLPPELREKPPLPRMRELRDDEIEQLAKVRGLSVEGVRVAAKVFRRVGFSPWPMWRRLSSGKWLPMCATHGLRCHLHTPECVERETFPSWVVTDDERRVAEFRRLDNERYPVRGRAANDETRMANDEGMPKGIKSWSTAGKNWPLGAADMGERMRVLLVEGAPDMLAAYHFLWGFGQLGHVAVVAMLGASARICDEALPFFKGKRVRICIDADEVQEKKTVDKKGVEHVKRTRPGYDAAARWTEQLTAAGAAVQGFNLEGLVRADGQPVKDLNDLALCDAATLEDEEIREAFIRWEF